MTKSLILVAFSHIVTTMQLDDQSLCERIRKIRRQKPTKVYAGIFLLFLFFVRRLFVFRTLMSVVRLRSNKLLENLFCKLREWVQLITLHTYPHFGNTNMSFLAPKSYRSQDGGPRDFISVASSHPLYIFKPYPYKLASTSPQRNINLSR